MKKKLLAFVCALTILSSGIPTLAADGMKVYVNNYEVVFQGQQPVVLNGRTLVPLRGVMEAMGVDVIWNEKDKSVFLKRDEREATFWVGKETFKGGRTLLEEPVQMINGSVMIPLRVVVNYFDGKLVWNAESKTASITIAEKEEGYATITYNKDLKDADGKVLIQGTARYPQLNEAIFGRNAKVINENISVWAKKGLEAYLLKSNDSIIKEAQAEGEKFDNAKYSISFKTPYYDDAIFSFCATAYSRSGTGAEESNAIGFTYDLKTGEKKTVSDFVSLPNNTTEQKYLKDIIKEHIRKNPGVYSKDAENVLEESTEIPIEFYMSGPKKMMVFVGKEGLIAPSSAGILIAEKTLP